MTNTTTPKTLTADEVVAALKPFYDLIGVHLNNIYRDAQPALVIGDDLRAVIRFRKVVDADIPTTEHEDWPIVAHSETDEFCELAYDIEIPVAGWPGRAIELPYPEGIPVDSREGQAILAAQTPSGEQVASGGHPPICPECANGKHPNCAGTALNEDTDEIVPCGCIDRSHASGTTP